MDLILRPQVHLNLRHPRQTTLLRFMNIHQMP